LINESIYWSTQLKAFKISKRGSSYPDALEFKRSGTWVDTYDTFYGIDKETGFKLDMPMDRSFTLSEDGSQIKMMIARYNTFIMNKYSNSFETRTNGTIYKDHPFINTVRTMISALELGDLDLVYQQFSDNSLFSDINAPRGTTISIPEEREKVEQILSQYNILSLDEHGYPDLLDYEGDGAEVLSWWIYRLQNIKTSKKVDIFMHLSHLFNTKGKITRQVAYWNGSLLK